MLLQINLEENLNSKQDEDIEEWLVRLNRLGKDRRLKNRDMKFIAEYIKTKVKKDVKLLIEGNEFMAQLPPTLRRDVVV